MPKVDEHPRCRRGNCNGPGRVNARSTRLQIWAPLRRMAWPRPATKLYRRCRQVRWHQQARRRISSALADPWQQVCHALARAKLALACTVARSAPRQCRDGCGGKQNGAGRLGAASLWRDVRQSGAPSGVELRRVRPQYGRRGCEDRSEYDGNTGRTGAGIDPLGASSFELVGRDWEPACGFTIKAGEAGRFATTGRIDDCSRGYCQKCKRTPCKSGGIHRCAQQKASVSC